MYFIETNLIKFDFNVKSKRTQRTAFCLLAFNILPFSAPLAKRAVIPIDSVEDPKNKILIITGK